MDNGQNQNRPKVRRAEIISSITVAGIIGLYSFIRTIAQDVNSLVETQGRNLLERQEQSIGNMQKLVDRDRQDCKEGLQEIRQRLIWLEREIQDKRKR